MSYVRTGVIFVVLLIGSYIGWRLYTFYSSEASPTIEVQGVAKNGGLSGDARIVIKGSDAYKVGTLQVQLDNAKKKFLEKSIKLQIESSFREHLINKSPQKYKKKRKELQKKRQELRSRVKEIQPTPAAFVSEELRPELARVVKELRDVNSLITRSESILEKWEEAKDGLEKHRERFLRSSAERFKEREDLLETDKKKINRMHVANLIDSKSNLLIEYGLLKLPRRLQPVEEFLPVPTAERPSPRRPRGRSPVDKK